MALIITAEQMHQKTVEKITHGKGELQLCMYLMSTAKPYSGVHFNCDYSRSRESVRRTSHAFFLRDFLRDFFNPKCPL